MEEYKQKLKKEVEDLVSFLNNYTKYDFVFDIIGKNYSFGFSNYTPTLIAVKTSEGVIEICQQIIGYRKTYCEVCNNFFKIKDFKDVENFWNEFKDSSLETTIKLVSISERDYYVIVDNNIYMDVVITIPETGTIAELPVFPIKRELSNLEWVRKERERHESSIKYEIGQSV